MMETINKGMKVVDNRDGRTGEITAKNSKYKTAVILYEDGEEKSVSFPTIKKNFSEVEVIETPDEEIQEEAVVEAEPATEAEEAVVEKKERKKRGKTKKSFEELVAMLPAHANLVFTRMSNDSVAVKCGKKRICRFASAGPEQYRFTADRCDNILGIEGARIIEKGNKKYVELRTADVDVNSAVAEILRKAEANGVYIR